MKDLSPYLQKAKERVANESIYGNITWLNRVAPRSDIKKYLTKAARLALQAQAEEYESKLNGFKEKFYEMSVERDNLAKDVKELRAQLSSLEKEKELINALFTEQSYELQQLKQTECPICGT